MAKYNIVNSVVLLFFLIGASFIYFVKGPFFMNIKYIQDFEPYLSFFIIGVHLLFLIINVFSEIDESDSVISLGFLCGIPFLVAFYFVLDFVSKSLSYSQSLEPSLLLQILSVSVFSILAVTVLASSFYHLFLFFRGFRHFRHRDAITPL